MCLCLLWYVLELYDQLHKQTKAVCLGHSSTLNAINKQQMIVVIKNVMAIAKTFNYMVTCCM